MNTILDELERSIRDALDDTPYWQQASLFEIDAERDQLRKDHDALRPAAGLHPGRCASRRPRRCAAGTPTRRPAGSRPRSPSWCPPPSRKASGGA